MLSAGAADLARAADDLAARVPAPLAPLARLAYDLHWSWAPGGPELFAAVDPARWERCGKNPIRLLQEASAAALARAADDATLVERAEALEYSVRADRERPPSDVAPLGGRPLAYLSAEFGVHVSLPIYAGGLGALAGDVLKEASDRALPFVGVGLLYRDGYFHQRIDASGWQHENWVDIDPERLPMALVSGPDGAPLTISVPVGERDVTAQLWRVDVGRVPLFLLDTDRPENDGLGRGITRRLYTGLTGTRLAQYVVLGAGGLRALAALGIEPALVHLNEGHAALAALELARAASAPADEALEAARRRTVFTTHTPVPAGNDAFPADQVAETLATLAGEAGLDVDRLLRLGRTHPEDDGEPFGVTQLALRTSRAAGGVSRRHGEVAREMWRELWPELPVDEVPITHVTNGVHLPTWLGPPMRELLDRHLGADWIDRAADPATWPAVDAIPDDELWAVRNRQRAELIEWLRGRSVHDRLAREDHPDYVEAAARTLDPEALTVGFARRVATYKRLGLLVQDAGRALGLLSGERPIQIVIAGKAHPRDEEAKRVVQRLFELKAAPEVAARVIFVDDYDLDVAARLVRGCDVWLNVPRPPLEASGTSGMKSAANGGLQLSVLDGWWAEAHDGTNGWALSGDVDPDTEAQDARHAEELLRLLEQEVVPAFHDREGDGIPRAWVARIRRSLATVAGPFSATRMLEDYLVRLYPEGAATAAERAGAGSAAS